jgi:hypothetical protein
LLGGGGGVEAAWQGREQVRAKLLWQKVVRLLVTRVKARAGGRGGEEGRSEWCC